MHLEKHTTWLAYLWAAVAGYFTHLTLNDWGALVGIALAFATFFVNRYYKQQSAQAQKARLVAMEERNRLIARLLEKSDRDSTLKILAASEIPEGSDGAEDES